MRKGAQSFASFSAFTIPAILLLVLVTGSSSGLWLFVGLFVLLQYFNKLDKRDIREEKQ